MRVNKDPDSNPGVVVTIMINDIVNSSNKFNFLMSADDTTIYFNLEDFPIEHREYCFGDMRGEHWTKFKKRLLEL